MGVTSDEFRFATPLTDCKPPYARLGLHGARIPPGALIDTFRRGPLRPLTL